MGLRLLLQHSDKAANPTVVRTTVTVVVTVDALKHTTVTGGVVVVTVTWDIIINH